MRSGTSPPAAPLLAKERFIHNPVPLAQERFQGTPVPLLAKERLGEVPYTSNISGQCPLNLNRLMPKLA